MDKTLRSILWILVVLVVLSSFSSGWFFVAKERLYNEYVTLENLFKTSMERLNRQLASSNKERTELKSKVEMIEKELRTLESRNLDLESQHKGLLSERDDLEKELVSAKKAKFYLEKKIKDMESEDFAAALLKEKVALEVELKRLKDTASPKDIEIERLKQENEDLRIRISMTDEEKVLLDQRLKDSTKVAEILSRDLLKERGRRKEDKQEYENVKIENRLLKTRISELDEASDKFEKLLAEKDNMQIKISALQREIENKSEEMERMRLAFERRKSDAQEYRAEAYHSPDKVELPPIVVQREDYGASRVKTSSFRQGSAASALEGRIVTINREHNFVVIDLGTKDGIDIGTRFNVWRGDLVIGYLEAIQTRKAIAACDIKEVKQGFNIEIDDIVMMQ